MKAEDVSSIKMSVIGCSLWRTAFDPAAVHGRFVVGTSAQDVFLCGADAGTLFGGWIVHSLREAVLIPTEE